MSGFFDLMFTGVNSIWNLLHSAWFMALPLVFFVFDRIYNLIRRLFV